MSQVALFIKHKALPGRRDEVRLVWEKYMEPAIASNPGHVFYFFCFDNSDPDSLCAFQQYASAEAADAFLKTRRYLSYVQAVEPLLNGAPQVTSLTPVWVKGE